MDRLFDFLIPAALFAVAATLAVGIYALFRGGDFARSNSNKLMRMRVVMQAVAILILLGALLWREHGL
ncbi:MAG TPA: twin transmembrane helix small protein [Phenylobacterium sp.]